MSNAPKQPADPPAEGSELDRNPPGQGRNGIANGQSDHQAKGTPTDERHATETVTSRIEDDGKA